MTITVVLAQHLELVALPVGKHIQRRSEWIQPQLLLDQYAQAVDGFAKVDRLPAKIDLFNITARVHQRITGTACTSAASHSGVGSADNSNRKPDGNDSVQLLCCDTPGAMRCATNLLFGSGVSIVSGFINLRRQ